MEVITHNRHRVNISSAERALSVFTGTALAFWGLRRRDALGYGLAAAGAEMVRRGATGHCYLYPVLGVRTARLGQGEESTSVPYELGIRVDKAITVDKPRDEVYRFWRQLDNLPRFMQHLESVTLDGNRSHWVAQGPAGRTVEWDAEIINEAENELIGWRSLPGSTVQNAGSVHFSDATGGRGTVVRVELQYNPPAGLLGAFAAQLWGEEPGQQIQDDLHRFKQIMEAGEIATVEGQTSGRAARGQAQKGGQAQKDSARVGMASEESFPASDAPAWRA